MNNPTMKVKLILLACIACCAFRPAFGWGKTGHDAIAYIAECNLTSRAKKNIEKYLDGRSIVYYASWMDQVRFTKPYRSTSKWHGFATDAETRYIPSPGEDAVLAIEAATASLLDYRHQDDSTVCTAIRYLVHLVGDMHCPVHIRYPWYEKFLFKIYGREYQIHSFWDAVPDIIHTWGYEDYRYQLDRCSKTERKALAAGTPREWADENARNCRVIYDWIKSGDNLTKAQSHDFMLNVQPLAEQQILKAGYRLARILNELFD